MTCVAFDFFGTHPLSTIGTRKLNQMMASPFQEEWIFENLIRNTKCHDMVTIQLNKGDQLEPLLMAFGDVVSAIGTIKNS